MRYVARYNIDHSLDIYPIFSNSRWDKYNTLKKRLENEKQKVKELNLDLFGCVKKSEYDKLHRIIEKENNLQVQIDELKPSSIRNNKKSDGFTLSKNSKRKVRYIINLMFEAYRKEKQKMEFYTFTVTKPKFEYLPEKHDDIVARQFQKMLKNLKKNYGLKQVVYVAERQKGKTTMNVDYNPTNRIHYHCIFIWDNVPPRVLQVNYYWLQLLNQVGFNTFSAKNLKEYVDNDVKKYEENYFVEFIQKQQTAALINNDITKMLPYKGMSYPTQKVRDKNGLLISNPFNKIIYHPVDVEPIRSIKKLANYLNKYVTKSDDKIFARVWGGTKSLMSSIKSVVFDEIEEVVQNCMDNIKKHWKTGEQMIKQFQFKLYPLQQQSPVFDYTKIYLSDESRGDPFFKVIRQNLIQNFIKTFHL